MLKFYPIHEDKVALNHCVLTTLLISLFFWVGSFFINIPSWLIIGVCLQVPLGFAVPSLYIVLTSFLLGYATRSDSGSSFSFVLAASGLAIVAYWIGAYLAYSFDGIKHIFKAKNKSS